MHAIAEDVLGHYQVRKTRKQKAAFRDFLKQRLGEEGIALREEKSRWLGGTNVIIGDIDSAKWVFTAHYDTCAVLPVPNLLFPKNIVLSLLYQICLFVPIVAILRLLRAEPIYGMLALLLLFGLMLFGPANRHTANDNTSGVVTLLEAVLSLSPDARGRVAFVLLDHEELGMLGASFLRKKHKQALKEKPVLNLDCVSDGDHFLVMTGKRFAKDEARVASIREGLQVPEGKSVAFTSHAFYPSDQVAFPHSAAIAAFHRAPMLGLFLGRIHTRRDTVMDRANIEALRGLIVSLA